MAVVGFGWYLATYQGPPVPHDTFVAVLRDQPLPDSLRGRGDEELVRLGEHFCTALKRTGSSLAVVFEDQQAGRVYDGESDVVTMAKRRLCPSLPDRDG